MDITESLFCEISGRVKNMFYNIHIMVKSNFIMSIYKSNFVHVNALVIEFSQKLIRFIYIFYQISC